MGLTALFGSLRGKAVDSDKLLHLYWNRAELKKEFANLRKEQFRLKDKIREREGAAARLQQQLERLEQLLLDPEWCPNVVVFYQLRSLALRCQRKLETFAEQLKQQRERRSRDALLEQWNADRAQRRGAVERELGAVRQRLAELEAEVAAETERLRGMGGLLRIFRRRSVNATLVRCGQEIRDAREAEAALLVRLDEIASESPPENPGLDLAAKRAINLMILSFAQQLFLSFDDPELAALAKEACDKSVGAIRYGGRRDCEALLKRIQARADALDASPDVAGLIKARSKLIAEIATYRNDGDAVPIAATVATVFDIRPNGQVRRSDVNLLGENYWGIARVLSR